MKQNTNVNYIKKVNIYREEMPLWFKNILKSIFITFIICCLFVAVFCFIYVYTTVDGKSMYPTLNGSVYRDDGSEIPASIPDSVYVNRFAGFTRGNIVVLENPSSSSTSKHVVKRVIAIGGDKISIVRTVDVAGEDNDVFNIFIIEKGTTARKILDETYLPTNTSLLHTFHDFISYKNTHASEFETIIDSAYGSISYLALNEDEIFVLGDNRSVESSFDSADYGPVNTSKYVGRVDIIVHRSSNNFSYIFLYFWHKLFG